MLRGAARIGLPLLAVSLLVVWWLYRADRRAAEADLIGEYRHVGSLVARDAALSLEQTVSDALYLSESPMIARWAGDPDPGTIAAIERSFLAFSRHKPRYGRIALLRADGTEVAAVDVARADGLVPVTQDEIEGAITRPSGSVVLAAVKVADGGARKAEPEAGSTIALVRATVPVLDPNGVARGLVVMEYRGERLLDRVADASAAASARFWLIDDAGRELLARGANGADGADLDLPSLAAEIRPVIDDGEEGGLLDTKEALVTFASVARPAVARGRGEVDEADAEAERPWILVGSLEKARITEALAGSAWRWGVVSVCLSLLVALGAWAMSAYDVRRRSAEADVRESEQKLRALLLAAPDAVVISDADGRILFFSEQAERLFGYSASEIVGQTIERLVPERHRAGHPAQRAKRTAEMARGPMSRRADLEARRKDGTEFPVAIDLSPVRTAQGDYVFSAIRDLSATHAAERAILELNGSLERRNAELDGLNEDIVAKALELEAANKELEAFSYSAAHDLRTPLRSIDGFSRVLLEKYAPQLDETARGYLARVRGAAQRMGTLLDDLLRLSRLSRAEVHKTVIDLSAMAREIAADLGEDEPDRDVRWSIAPGMRVGGDLQLVRAAMENLMGNAWKYTSGREVAHIEVGVDEVDRESVFFVKDDGAGFDAAHLDKLFRPFQRLHNATEFPGTGVGLALVQRIVQRHGGRIWAEGAVGRGATFRFTLARPRRTGTMAAVRDDEHEGEVASRAKEAG